MTAKEMIFLTKQNKTKYIYIIANLKACISSCSAALDLRIASSVGRKIEQRK
jgi:hypothetical protein